MIDPDKHWSKSLRDAVGEGKTLVKSVDEFNRVFDHIIELLSSAVTLYFQGSAPAAAFFAITALEETSKAHIGMWRRSESDLARRTDALYNHRKKQLLAASPTVSMGTRLNEALGRKRVAALVEEARTGGLATLRESCIYFDRSDGELHVPSDHVDKARARELVLFSVEAFDDALVGLTTHSIERSRLTDEFFAKIAREPAE